MSETVSLDVQLNSPIDRVWQALTEPATLSRWLMFEAEEFRPVVGHKFRLHAKASTGWSGVVEGEVLEVDAPRRLVYTWAVADQGHRTTVRWRLSPVDEAVTRLELEQSGFAPEAKQEIGGAKYGWAHMLEQLRSVLESAA